MKRISRILLLGHSGFIGAALFKRLSREYAGSAELLGLSYPEIDLSESGSVQKLRDLLGPETAVVMLAGIKRQWGDTLDTLRKNLDITVNVCRALEEKHVQRFIFFSSAAVYGEEVHNLSVNESSALTPTSLYGTAKLASEMILGQMFKKNNGAGLVCLRPPLVYGPGDTSKGYGPAGFIDAVLNRTVIRLWGDGTELRDFVFVEDVAEIVARLIGSDHSGPLNCATGKNHAYRDILDILREIDPSGVRIEQKERTRPKLDQGFDPAKIAGLFPDIRFTSLKEGIERTYSFMKGAA